jgi:hypothetical protein
MYLAKIINNLSNPVLRKSNANINNLFALNINDTNKNIATNIEQSLKKPTCGVHLLYSSHNLYDSINNSICRSYSNCVIDGLLYINCNHPNYLDRIQNKFTVEDKIIDVNLYSNSLIKSLSKTLIKSDSKILLLVEDIDCLFDQFKQNNSNYIESFVVSLAEQSVFTKKFTALIPTCNINNYNQMIKWNDGAKIHRVITE